MSLDQHQPKSEPAGNAWLLTFADLVSLMITFFVMLYAMKSVDVVKWEQLKGSLSGALSYSELARQTPTQDNTVEKLRLVEQEPLNYLENVLALQFRNDPLLSQAELVRDLEEDTLKIVMPSHLLFPSGRAGIVDKGKTAILRLGDALRNVENSIQVAGHTDPIPISTEQYPTNWELSMMRALNVTELLHQAGVEAPIVSRGLGPSRYYAVAPNAPEEERLQRARRVEVILNFKTRE